MSNLECNLEHVKLIATSSVYTSPPSLIFTDENTQLSPPHIFYQRSSMVVVGSIICKLIGKSGGGEHGGSVSGGIKYDVSVGVRMR